MALSALTLTVSKGVSGRRFRSKLNGLTAGTVVEIDGRASPPGFSEVNGFLVNPSVSLGYGAVVVTERVPATGETRTTNLLIEVLSRNEVRRQTEELGTFQEPYAALQEDGSELWTIRARGAGGQPIDETAGVELPEAISDLTATAQSDTEIEIDWTEAVGATSHEYRVDGGSAVAASGPPMTIAELDADTEYGFEVRGVNADGDGPWSDVATETTNAGGGGGGGNTVPTGATQHSDFANGFYWNGAEVALAAMWGENLNWGSFDPARVVASTGLTDDGSGTANPVLITPGDMSAGDIFVITGVTGGADTNLVLSVCDIAAFAGETDVKMEEAAGSGDFFIKNYNHNGTHITDTAGAFKVAASITPSLNAISANGSAQQTIATDGNANDTIALVCSGAGAIKTVTRYPAGYAALATLSAP